MKSKKIQFTTTHVIMLGFFATILLGSLLLSLPISSRADGSVSYIDALFTATSATCVTGLVTLPTATTWSVFGQAVILLLIQVGGLGVITVMTGFMLAIHKKIGIKDSYLIQDAFNLNTMMGLADFVKHVIVGTLIVESIGALVYMTVFIPDFGARGIWISVFNSVSAFCNAGMDIIGEFSLYDYATNPVINITTELLIVLGGIGYIVWWDVIRVIKKFKSQRLRCFSHLTLHSKLAISATLVLIFGGALAILAFEYNNPETFKNFSTFDKIQASVFQSVTNRTAGFATIPQENLTNSSAMLSMVLMIIGGSPVGTAGGIKTVTFTILFAAVFATVKGKEETTVFNRGISKELVLKAGAVTGMFFTIIFISTILLSCTISAPTLDIMFETVSATATVGLSRNLTSLLNLWGKLIIISAMYFGRIGPITLAIAFNVKRQSTNIVKNPVEDITVG